MTRTGVTLHTFRDVDRPLPEILHRIADHGFEGVEFAGRVHNAETDEVQKTLEETGLESIAAHITLSRLEENLDDLLEQYATLDCYHLVIPHLPPSHFLTFERIDELTSRLRSLADRLEDRGFTLVVHNTRPMHRPVLDQYGFERMVESSAVPTGPVTYFSWGLDHLIPAYWRGERGFERFISGLESSPIVFEIDTQHAESLGEDPHQLFERVSDKLFAVHLSDGIQSSRFPPSFQSTPLGEGIVDVGRNIRGAVEYNADWLVGEVDDPPDPHESFESISNVVNQR